MITKTIDENLISVIPEDSEDLGIPKLLERVISENISEVILALNSTMEGQTTAHYIAFL